MMECKTVRVKSDAQGQEGGVVINESDFDASIHKLFDEPAKDTVKVALVEKKTFPKKEKLADLKSS